MFSDCFVNLLNVIWRMVRLDMCVLDYVIWFLVGSVSAVVEIKSDIQIIYYFHVTLYNYVQTIVLKYFLQAFLTLFYLRTTIENQN